MMHAAVTICHDVNIHTHSHAYAHTFSKTGCARGRLDDIDDDWVNEHEAKTSESARQKAWHAHLDDMIRKAVRGMISALLHWLRQAQRNVVARK